MPSTIDPTRPDDGMPASKADLRANLVAAKAEIEHGGFAEGLSPINYGPPASPRVADHLQAIDEAFGAAKGGDASTTSYIAPGVGAITRTVRDRLSDLISVKDLGAKGDGKTDDTAAFTAALHAAFDMPHPNGSGDTEQSLQGQTGRITGALLLIPPGLYRLRNWRIDKVITVIGCGRASRLAPTDDAELDDCVVKVARGSHAYRNRGNHHPGVTLSNFMIDGLARSIDCTGLVLDFLDRSAIEHLTIEETVGPGLRLFSSVRESTFLNIRMKFCGDASRPMLDMRDMSETSDSHNNLHFIGCGFEYPVGDMIRIGHNPSNSSPARSLFFSNCLFHGMTSTQHAHVREAPTRIFHVTSGENIHISGSRIHAWGAGEAAIHLTHEEGQNPSTGVRAAKVLTSNCNFGRPFDETGAPQTPNQTSPHVRIEASSTWVEVGNSYALSEDAVVDRQLGIHRRYTYVDNPV